MLIGDALMMSARAELGAGRVRPARRTAAEAAGLFRRTGRNEMVAHAEEVLALSALQEAGPDDAIGTFDRSNELVARLRGLGWHQQADELSIARIRTAWRTGVWRGVADDLSSLRLHAFGVRRDQALLGWFAEAVSRRLDGDEEGAIEASRSGLAFLDDIIAEATSLEARSAAMRLGRDLSRVIIEVAVDQDDADLALAASEGTRARSLHDELDQPARHRPLTEEGAERLRAELRGRLLHRCLVQWVVAAGRVYAVVCDQHGNRLVDVADHRSLVRDPGAIP